MQNVTFTLYGFHLKQSLDDNPNQQQPDASKIWDSLNTTITSLQFAPINDQFDDLIKDHISQIKINLKPAGNQQLTISGKVLGFNLHDTYCCDINLKTEKEIQAVDLNTIFQVETFLTKITADLGLVSILYAEQKNWSKPSEQAKTLANTICQGTSYKPSFIGEITLFNVPFFVFEAERLTVLVGLAKIAQLDMDKYNKYYNQIRDLFGSERKIETSYLDAQQAYKNGRVLYNRLEETFKQFQTIFNHPYNSTKRIKELDQLIQKIPQDLLYFQSCLRDLKTHCMTIETNIHNFQIDLDDLVSDGNQLEIWSKFYSVKYPGYLAQVKTYINFLEPGKDLFSDLINTIRAATETELAKNEHALQDQIQAVGVGIATGSIIASCSGFLFTSMRNFVITATLSIIVSILLWYLVKKFIERWRQVN